MSLTVRFMIASFLTALVAASLDSTANQLSEPASLQPILEHNALWLAPDAETFPALSYTLRAVQPDTTQAFAFDKMPGAHERRGITLWSDLDAFLAAPDQYEVRRNYEGMWEGAPVVMLSVSGPRYKLERGNGVRRTWYGYTSSPGEAAELAVDRATSRPLAILAGERQIRFLDYVEVSRGRHAPLRVVWYDEGREEPWDFRFQVLDGRVWLLDESRDGKGEPIVRIENIRIDGAAPKTALRQKEVARAQPADRFASDRVTDRRNLAPENALLDGIREANRAWLNPDFGGLQSVSFVHRMEPKLLDESFAWRRDGTSLLAVVARDDEAAKQEIGRGWVTTPEPASYYLSPQSRVPGAPEIRLAKKEDVKPDYFLEYFRDHLMGTRVSFALLDWGRNPDQFHVKEVKAAEAGGHAITLVPKDSRYDVHGGAMFHTTSWAYIPGARVSRIEIVVDAQLRPVREIDYSDKKECEIEFLDWRDIGGGHAVPGRVRLEFPEHKFTVEDRFAWHPEGLWILESGESKFEDPKQGTQREVIRDLKINQPIASLDEALATVRNSEAYLNARPASHTLTLSIIPFVLGNRIPITLTSAEGMRVEAGVLFTLDEKGGLVAEVDAQASSLKQPRQSVIAILDSEGRLLGANRTFMETKANGARFLAAQPLGDFDALTSSQCFLLALEQGGSDAPALTAIAAQSQTILVAAYPFRMPLAGFVSPLSRGLGGLGPSAEDRGVEPLAIDVADQQNGLTRAKRAVFQIWNYMTGSDLVASVQLISADHWNLFDVSASMMLLDENGALVTANRAREPVRFQVSQEIASTATSVNLGPAGDLASARYFVPGILRSQDYGIYHGHGMWMTYMRRERGQPAGVPFSIERLLAAEDPRVWAHGVRAIDRQLRSGYFQRGILDDENDYRQYLERGQAPEAILRPYAARLEQLLNAQGTPEAKALVVRLLGYANRPAQREPFAALMNDPSEGLRDAAAIAIGLMGDARGIERLKQILARPRPEDNEAYSARLNLQTDAAMALRAIKRDESMKALGEALLAAIDGITVTPAPGGGEGIGGTYELARRLVYIVGRTDHELARRYLSEAAKKEEKSSRLDRELKEMLER